MWFLIKIEIEQKNLLQNTIRGQFYGQNQFQKGKDSLYA